MGSLERLGYSALLGYVIAAWRAVHSSHRRSIQFSFLTGHSMPGSQNWDVLCAVARFLWPVSIAARCCQLCVDLHYLAHKIPDGFSRFLLFLPCSVGVGSECESGVIVA